MSLVFKRKEDYIKKLAKLVDKFLNLDTRLDANWILTGSGKMLKQENEQLVQKDKAHKEETRPRILYTAVAGSFSNVLMK